MVVEIPFFISTNFQLKFCGELVFKLCLRRADTVEIQLDSPGQMPIISPI